MPDLISVLVIRHLTQKNETTHLVEEEVIVVESEISIKLIDYHFSVCRMYIIILGQQTHTYEFMGNGFVRNNRTHLRTIA